MAITQPTISEATADAVQGTTDSGTGVAIIAHGVKPTDTPKLRTVATQQAYQLAKALEGVLGGWVFDKESGLDVGVKGLKYRLGTTEYTLADDDVFTCTDDRVNYLYCDADQVVEEAAAWPGADHYKLAIVTCAAGQVTNVVQARQLNHTIGIDSAWSTCAAAQDVAMAGHALNHLGEVELEAPTELTISGGAITVTQAWHYVDGEGGADDNLDTINENIDRLATDPLLLILSLDPTAAPTQNITVRHGFGNIFMPTGEQHTLSIKEDSIAFLRMPNTQDWVEIWRNPPASTFLTDINLGASGVGITECNHFGGSFSPDQQIAGGIVTRYSFVVGLRNETDALEDDLDTMTGGYSAFSDPGEFAILTNRQVGQTTHVKHAASGANKFYLLNGNDCDLDATSWLLVVRSYTGDDMWYELARSPIDLKHLAGTSHSIPYEQNLTIAGALVSGNNAQWLYVKNAFTLFSATGVVATAPVGGPCYVDVQVDPLGDGTGFASIFVNDAERINIADGTAKDTSAQKKHAVAAGSLIRLSIIGTSGSPNGASDLAVVLHGQIDVQAAP